MIALGACVENVPVTYKELEGRPDEEDWQRAVHEEMTALKENETWTLEECKPVKTPMVLKPANETEKKDKDVPEKPYRELVGSLMFLMLNTRPDISTAVNYYSRFQSEPKHSHCIELKRILRYL
jgi:hypothetical protein